MWQGPTLKKIIAQSGTAHVTAMGLQLAAFRGTYIVVFLRKDVTWQYADNRLTWVNILKKPQLYIENLKNGIRRDVKQRNTSGNRTHDP